jgi:hypothetical protein
MSSCALRRGTPGHALEDRPVLMKSISMPTFSLEAIHKKGNEATGAAMSAPKECASLRSSVGYDAQGVRGDPRGRKFGAGLGTTNLRWPARAEGEKRFRSATRNP